jgi:ABC-type metal ion transport system substrate-binding protein
MNELEKLIEAKRKNENEMYTKFAILLNKKKLKLRELESSRGQIPDQ